MDDGCIVDMHGYIVDGGIEWLRKGLTEWMATLMMDTVDVIDDWSDNGIDRLTDC